MNNRVQVAPDAVQTGGGGLPEVVLTTADGARVEAYLHGAHVTSWRPAGSDDERLFLSPLAHFQPGGAIRGGVPVCFPQFADQGSLPMHGFARDRAWDLVVAGRSDSGAAHALFRLTDSPETRAIWPHAFVCEHAVTASGASLSLAFAVTNAGTQPFSFTAALHTYLRVDDVREVRVQGLAGARYRDKVLRQDDLTETARELVVDRPLDRVYRVVPESVVVREPTRALAVHAAGTTDTVIWNPGPTQDRPGADLSADAYLSMLCVEAALASTMVTLAPGESFRATQTLTALPQAAS